MSIHGMPLILFKVSKGGILSDIEFLAIKEFDGKLRSDEGFLSAIGDLATLTATAGKDMYIARAKVTFYVNSNTEIANLANKVELKLNGTVIETSPNTLGTHNGGSGAGGGVLSYPYEFKNIGHSVTTGQIIKLEVITLGAETDVEGFIECFEEDTNTTPQIPSI